MSERVNALVFAGMRVVSAYQPIWGSDEEGMREYRRALEIQVAMGGRERLVIGGDFNANVGRRNERQGVCGKYGVGRMNEAGRALIDWCEEWGLAYVNSFMRHDRGEGQFQQGEAPGELQGVGPRRWTKALTRPEWSNWNWCWRRLAMWYEWGMTG